ncbi:MAG: glycosyltransferase family 4 protein [Nitratireductor sp.]
MHLVFVTSLVPDGAPTTGYEIANAAIIAALRRSGVRVTVLGYTWPGKAPSDPQNTVALGSVDVRTQGAPAIQKMKWLAGAMASGLTVSSAKMRAASEQDLRAALKRIGPFDAYVLNAVQLAGAYEHLFTDKPSIFVAHNVEFRSALENAAAARDLFQRALFRREARLLRAMEERLCRQARFVFTLAEEDRDALGVAGPRSAALALVTRDEPPRPQSRKTAFEAGMIGTWSWEPNRIGLDWFLREVAPRLPADFRVRIAGHVPAGLGQLPPGVEFVGRVPDASDFVRQAAVVPLIAQAGTGVQLKTIETFELGLPSVATSRSLRGVSYLPSNCTVADDPAAFAGALVERAAGQTEAIDGSTFHAGQIRALDAAIAKGLEALGSARSEVAA